MLLIFFFARSREQLSKVFWDGKLESTCFHIWKNVLSDNRYQKECALKSDFVRGVVGGRLPSKFTKILLVSWLLPWHVCSGERQRGVQALFRLVKALLRLLTESLLHVCSSERQRARQRCCPIPPQESFLAHPKLAAKECWSAQPYHCHPLYLQRFSLVSARC